MDFHSAKDYEIALTVKLQRPSANNVLKRTRLFKALDRRRNSPLQWIHGPAGSGKTTLLSSYAARCAGRCLWYRMDGGDRDPATFFYYLGRAAQSANRRKRKPMPLLTPEFLMGIPAFSRSFFDQLFARLGSPALMVFDNVQEAAGEAEGILAVIVEGLAHVPDGVTAAFLSRRPPPAQLAAMRLNETLAVLGWDELRLTEAEARALAGRKTAREKVRVLHEKASGWVAGFRMLLEGTNGQVPEDFVPDEIFDFFAAEIFDRMTPEERRTLLGTAFLSNMSGAMAREASGVEKAGDVLGRLSKDNYFTEKREGKETRYSYHPLFQGFLAHRAGRDLGTAECSALRKKSAKLMAAQGAMEDAAALYVREAAWPELAELVKAHARELAGQGRSRPLHAWLSAMPRELVGRDPWLLYWLGASALPYDQAESLRAMERAFEEFRRRREAVGAFLAWSGAVEAIVLGFQDFKLLDRWVDMQDALLRELGQPPEGEPALRFATSMYRGLVMGNPGHPQFKKWQDLALALSEKSASVDVWILTFFHHIHYLQVTGDLSAASVAMDRLVHAVEKTDASPLAVINARMSEALIYNFLMDPARCRRAVESGLAFARETGIHLFDFMLMGQYVWISMRSKDYADAQAYLTVMEKSLAQARSWDRALYHYLRASEALENEDLRAAESHARILQEIEQMIGGYSTGMVYRGIMALVMHALGKTREARRLNRLSVEEDRKAGGRIITFSALLHEAAMSLDEGDRRAALEQLRKALALGRKQRYLNPYFWCKRHMRRLCALALEEGIEEKYAADFVRAWDLTPEPGSPRPEKWPWPVRVFTLGRFAVEVSGKRLDVGARAPKKVLEMLKALVCLGHADVDTERLEDALWPEAEGDRAHKSFEMTLLRLRRLLGKEKYLVLRSGTLSLEPSYCWSDVQALEQDFGRAAALWAEGCRNEAAALCEKALGLYRGRFLPADEDREWTAPMRQRLGDRHLHLVLGLGVHCQDTGQWSRAVEVFLGGLEASDFSEELCRHVMFCYWKLGLGSRSKEMYSRLCQALEKRLGTAPGEGTRSLHASICADRPFSMKHRPPPSHFFPV